MVLICPAEIAWTVSVRGAQISNELMAALAPVPGRMLLEFVEFDLAGYLESVWHR